MARRVVRMRVLGVLLVVAASGCGSTPPAPSAGRSAGDAPATRAVDPASGPPGSAQATAPADTPVDATMTADPSAPPVTPTPVAPTPAPPTAGIIGGDFGARELLARDDMATPLWGTGEEDQGTVRYAAGRLAIELSEPDASLWTWRSFGDAHPVMSVAAKVATGPGEGGVAVMCGSAADDFVFAGVVLEGDERRWVLGQLAAGEVALSRTGVLPADVGPTAADPEADLGVECAGLSTGSLRMRLSVDGTPIASEEEPLGPGRFDRAGLYADATSTTFSASFDEVEVRAGETFAGASASDSP